MAGGSDSLHILAEGPQLTLTYGGDKRRLLFTDGRKVRTQPEEGEEIIQRTRWRDEHLEIETTAGQGEDFGALGAHQRRPADFRDGGDGDAGPDAEDELPAGLGPRERVKEE
jgi:hypothetical protein